MATHNGNLTVNGPTDLNGAVTIDGALTQSGEADFHGSATFYSPVVLSSTLTLPAGAIDSADLTNGSVDPVHLASGYRTVAANAAVTLAASDRTILLLDSSDASAKAFTMTPTQAGHRIMVRLVARSSTGSYTAAVSGGAVTFNAANEAAEIVFDGSSWQLVALMGATLV